MAISTDSAGFSGGTISPAARICSMVGIILFKSFDLPESIAAGNTYIPVRIMRFPASNLEGDGNNRLEFEDVGYIIDEGLRLAGMDEPDSRSITGGENCRFADAVETRSGGGQATIRNIATSPIGVVVIAIVPFHPVLLGQQLVHLANPGTLDPPKLHDASLVGRFFLEAEFVHFPDNLESSGVVERQFGLIQETVGPRTARLAGRIESNTCFAYPGQQTANPGSKHHRGMRDPRAGFQHQAADTANRDVRSDTILVDYDKGAIQDI